MAIVPFILVLGRQAIAGGAKSGNTPGGRIEAFHFLAAATTDRYAQ